MNEKEKIERDSFVFYRSFYEAIKDLCVLYVNLH